MLRFVTCMVALVVAVGMVDARLIKRQSNRVATESSALGMMKFYGPELQKLGSEGFNVFYKLAKPRIPEGTYPIKFSERKGSRTLQFGDIVALTGLMFRDKKPIIDHCAKPDKLGAPLLSEKELEEAEKRFLQSYDVMESEADFFGLREADQILDLWKLTASEWKQRDAMRARNSGQVARQKFGHLLFKMKRHLYELSHYDSDSYGNCALKAYVVGHGLALKQAARAKDWPENQEKRQCLAMALALEGMATYYLAQLFSSDGARVPRAEVINECGLVDAMALTRPMIEEEAFFGFPVKNHHNDQWFMFGRGRLADRRGDNTRRYTVEAIANSLKEVFAAFEVAVRGMASQPATIPTLHFLPKIEDEASFPPLLKYDSISNRVLVRDFPGPKSGEAAKYSAITDPHTKKCRSAAQLEQRVINELESGKSESGLEPPTWEDQKFAKKKYEALDAPSDESADE